MTDIRIEPVGPERLAAVQTLLAYRVFDGDLERVAELVPGGTGLTFVAFAGQDLVGFVTVSWPPSHPLFREQGIPEIRHLMVFGPYRRRGIGSRLMDVAEAWAAQHSDRLGLCVGVFAPYGPAHRFYAQRGYRPTGEGLCRGHEPVGEGTHETIDDGLLFWLVKDLELGDDG